MKLKTQALLTFIRNNPQHFNDLHPLIKQYFDTYPTQSCGFCPGSIKPNDKNSSSFKSLLLCNSEIRKLILDKSNLLLDTTTELEDFSVNECSESNQNK